jgi:Yip1 domain
MTESAAAPVPARGLLARATGVIFSPRATFEAVVQTPKPFGAMLVVAVVSAAAFGIFLSTEVGRAASIASMTERSGGQMTPEQLAGFERMAPYLGAFQAVSVLLFTPIVTAFLAGIAYVVFNAFMGGTATFRQLMAVVAHSQFISMLSIVFTTPLNYLRGTMTSATNLGVFLPMLEPRTFLAGVVGAIDLFLIWWIVGLSIGLSVLYRRKTGSVATGFLIVYGLVALVIGFVQSR